MMLSVEEARERVLAAVDPLDPQQTLLADAPGLVAAADLFAPHALPRFDNSAMDGYALQAADTNGAAETSPVELAIVGEVRAGDPGDARVRAGAAVRIMTGAVLPQGADSVVPVEQTEEREERVLVKATVAPGRHVRPAGDDVDKGALVVRKGTELGPGEIAVCASLGLSPLPVRRGPKVAVLVTGDELVAPETEPRPGQIRDSNSLALQTLARDAGAELLSFDRVADTRQAVVEAFERAAEAADLIVSSGGVAVGKYDFVKEVIEELGHIELWRVAMQPGKPVVLGSVGDVPFLGLPGNPVSIHIGFEQFVRPAIRKMRGCAALLRPQMAAILDEKIEKSPGRLHFVRVRLESADGAWRALPTGAQGSHIQSSLVDCHGVVRFERDLSVLEAGSEVTVEVWRLPEAQ